MSAEGFGGVTVSFRAFGAVAAQIVAAMADEDGPCMEGRRKDRMPTRAITEQGYELEVSLDSDTVAGLTVACMLSDQAEVGNLQPSGVTGVLRSMAEAVAEGIARGIKNAGQPAGPKQYWTPPGQPAAPPVHHEATDTAPHAGPCQGAHDPEPDAATTGADRIPDEEAEPAAIEPSTPTNGTGTVKEVAIEVKEGGTTASFVATKAGSPEPPAPAVPPGATPV